MRFLDQCQLSMAKFFSKQLLDALKAKNLVSAEVYATLEQESVEAKKDLEELIREKGILDEEGLAKLKSEILNIPYVSLFGVEILPDVLKIISAEMAKNYQVVAFAEEGKDFSVAMVNPRDFHAVESIDFLAEERHSKVHYYITSPLSFVEAIQKYEVLGEEMQKSLEEAKSKFVFGKEEKVEEKEGATSEMIKKAPVADMVAKIMKNAVENNASDIHIEPESKATRVRYRIDGELTPLLTLPKYIHSAIIARIKVLANLKLDETRLPQDGRIRQKINGKEIDFRISTLPLLDDEKVVMRVLKSGDDIPTLEELGFRREFIATINKEIKKPHGLFLITGPTGSGKSTTLYTILSLLNKENINIVTLEDPIEYFVEGVNQAQIRPEIGFHFASGLRSLLRQDPNIIMVGEIRDGETAELAIHAALTGHMLFSTLHTNDAIGAVPRLIDMKMEPFLLASTLSLIMAQRLVRKLCPYCKEKIYLPQEMEDKVRAELSGTPVSYFPVGLDMNSPLVFYHGKGCRRCEDGYKGRTVIAEIIEVNPQFAKLITEGYKAEEVKRELKRQGAIFMKQDGLLKALEGSTTIEEVLRATEE